MSTESLATLGGRDYIGQIKDRLRRQRAWEELLVPELIGRTRWGLLRLSASLESQIERAADDEETDAAWLRGVTTLLGLVQGRLNELPASKCVSAPRSNSRDARAWRTFAASMAEIVADVCPEYLEGVRTPYGDLGVEEWLAAREAKRLSRAEEEGSGRA